MTLITFEKDDTSDGCCQMGAIPRENEKGERFSNKFKVREITCGSDFAAGRGTGASESLAQSLGFRV
jgi:hypothetical protein